ncbi:hypothetical protein BJY54_002502 [Streptomyces nodosus]|uniref:Uncharacterized protein n=1 Tax=Streptomyces nodosus TaxID=40318 RepID=A0A0B5DLB8_9ACTN|nr:hypothetical protein [Streptomyces nodosus]AJE40812.1 hypothetical protein SNOD_12675 [Streptomyces nodosus]MBB4791890.1 hypothetical protein [Streptomyces nodosus]
MTGWQLFPQGQTQDLFVAVTQRVKSHGDGLRSSNVLGWIACEALPLLRRSLCQHPTSPFSTMRVRQDPASCRVQPGQHSCAWYLIKPTPCCEEDFGDHVIAIFGIAQTSSYVRFHGWVMRAVQRGEVLLMSCVHIPSNHVDVQRPLVLTAAETEFRDGSTAG